MVIRKHWLQVKQAFKTDQFFAKPSGRKKVDLRHDQKNCFDRRENDFVLPETLILFCREHWARKAGYF